MTSLPPTTAIETELDRGWLTIWFNQPDNRNALSAELTGELRAILETVRDDRSVRGITLRGRGGVFCAGGDLKSFRAGQASGQELEDVVALSKEGATLFDLVNTMPQVVVARVEGAAIAGGLGLACCADTVICEAATRFAFSERMIGLTPAQISPFVIAKAGQATARRLMLTAAQFDGEEAGRLGLADLVGAGEAELDAHEHAIRRQVLKCAPGAVADIKALILALPGLGRAEAIEAAAENFAGRMVSAEGREGIGAFLEKRKPNWTVEP